MKYCLGILLLTGSAYAKSVNLSASEKATVKAQLVASGNKFIAASDLEPEKGRRVAVDFGTDKNGKIYARGQIIGALRIRPGKLHPLKISPIEGQTILQVSPAGVERTVLSWGHIHNVSLDNRPGVVGPPPNSPARLDWTSWKGAEVFGR